MPRQLHVTGEQLNLGLVISEFDHSFESHAQPFKDSDRSVIVNRRYRDDSVQAEAALSHRQHRRCRFVTIPLAPMIRKERKADIDIIKAFSLYQTADSNGGLTALQLTQVQPKPEALVAFDRALQDVIASVVECPDAFVSDKLQEGRTIDQLENEFSIFGGQPAQYQPVRFQNIHCRFDQKLTLP